MKREVVLIDVASLGMFVTPGISSSHYPREDNELIRFSRNELIRREPANRIRAAHRFEDLFLFLFQFEV